MTGSAPLDSFIGKWRERWPEWSIAMAFVPQEQRTRAAAWLSLLQEWRDAAWAGSEPAPGLAKLAWWQEELRGWAKGARRHPLGEALQKVPAPWDALGLALAALPATRAPASSDADAEALRAFADALLACESVLFDELAPASPTAREAVVEALRAERAWAQGEREGAVSHRDAITTASGLSRVRRLQHAIVRARLRVPAGRPGAFRLLWSSWRAARGA